MNTTAFSDANKLAQNILDTLRSIVESNHVVQINPYYVLSYTDQDTIIIDYAEDEVVINPRSVSLTDSKTLVSVATDLMGWFQE